MNEIDVKVEHLIIRFHSKKRVKLSNIILAIILSVYNKMLMQSSSQYFDNRNLLIKLLF